MRKEWIRTDEEKQMRQLQKLAKEQRKLNGSTNARQPLVNLPIVARKKKRLTVVSSKDDLPVEPVNVIDRKKKKLFIILSFRCI